MKESFEHNKCEMNTALCLFALYEYNIQNYIKNQIKSNHQIDEFAHQIYFLFFFSIIINTSYTCIYRKWETLQILYLVLIISISKH